MRLVWKLWVGLGAIAILGGTFALLDPLRNLELQIEAVTVALEYFMGWLFVVLGAALTALGWHPHHRIRWRILPIGVAMFLAGLFLLLDPSGGEWLFTVCLALTLSFSGCVKILLGWELRPSHAAGWIVAAGLVSLAVGLLVLFRFPASAKITLGAFLAVDMIATGAMLVLLAFRRHEVEAH